MHVLSGEHEHEDPGQAEVADDAGGEVGERVGERGEDEGRHGSERRVAAAT